MATLKSRQVLKKNRNRGLYVGKEQPVTGTIVVKDGASIATTDLIQLVQLGENVRPHRILLMSTPISGNPVLTNPTFNIGVAPLLTGNFARPNGDTYAPVTTSASVLSAGLVIPANDEIVDVDIPRPVADSVSKYGPYLVTATPAGAGAFSVAGGDIELSLTVVFNGEGSNISVYDEFVNQKVKNA